MKCDICNINDAVIFIQEIRGTEKRNKRLCMECASKRGIPTHNLDGSINPEKLSLEKIISTMAEKRSCKVCGRSLDDIKKYKVVGCPACYSNFLPEIQEILQEGKAHKTYRGSFPKHVSDGRSSLHNRVLLQEKLEESIAKEDFEKAAIYRDKIKELDKKDE